MRLFPPLGSMFSPACFSLPAWAELASAGPVSLLTASPGIVMIWLSRIANAASGRLFQRETAGRTFHPSTMESAMWRLLQAAAFFVVLAGWFLSEETATGQ